jgi:hypothetical protein
MDLLRLFPVIAVIDAIAAYMTYVATNVSPAIADDNPSQISLAANSTSDQRATYILAKSFMP